MIRSSVITRFGRENILSALINGSAWTLGAIGIGDSDVPPSINDFDLLGKNKYYVNCSPLYNKTEGYIQFNYSFSGKNISFDVSEIGIFKDAINTSGYMFLRAVCDTVKFQNESDWLNIIIILGVP